MGENYFPDSRQINDIEEQIKKLAEGYTPEWKFSLENPDTGSAIGIIFARQMYENIKRYNNSLIHWQNEYMNMLGISLKAAQPARMLAVFEAVAGQEYCLVPQGTSLVADVEAQEGGRLLFETVSRLCVVSSKIEVIALTCKKSFLEKQLYVQGREWEPVNLNRNYVEEQFKKKLGLLHKSAFQVNKRPFTMYIDGSIDFGESVKNGEYKIYYRTKKGLEPVSVLKAGGKNVTMFFPEKPEIFTLDEEEIDEDSEVFSELVIEQIKPVNETIQVKNIEFRSSGQPEKPDYIYSGNVQQDRERFYIFGKQLNLYSECLIGCDDYFGQRGSRINMSFQLSYETRLVSYQPEKEEDLSIIKRKKKNEETDITADAYAQSVQFEYYSKNGWKRLETENLTECRKMFGEAGNAGVMQISFVCPEDWIQSEEKGYCGRLLRIQLVESELCYYQPCRHHLPVIENLQIEYSYDICPVHPDMYRITENDKEELRQWEEGEKVVFSPVIIECDALYIGFDTAPARGPVSIYFKLEDNRSFLGIPLRFEYYSAEGYKQMAVIDYTDGGRRSGTIEFMPQEDFAKTIVAGKESYYIRIVDVNSMLRNMQNKRPVISHIYMNAVEALNLHTLEPMEFFVDTPKADMEFDLGIEDIYDVKVMVNNGESFEQWQETDSFTDTRNKKVYRLDKKYGKLIFGDGKNTEIPKVMGDVAFTVSVRTCNGIEGNVPAHSIEKSLEQFGMIAGIDNPYSAYGGADIESDIMAGKRGIHIMSSSGRLVTRADFEREALSFSDSIMKVSCHSDSKGKIHLTLLMREYAKGQEVFYNIQGRLLDHLLRKSELTIKEEDIIIKEPMFALVSVRLWIKAVGEMDSFEIQEQICSAIDRYLETVGGNNGEGWNIGEIPSNEQIIMKLNFLKKDVIIKNCVVTAVYTDDEGVHEVSLEQLAEIPDIVVGNGKHTVQVTN